VTALEPGPVSMRPSRQSTRTRSWMRRPWTRS